MDIKEFTVDVENFQVIVVKENWQKKSKFGKIFSDAIYFKWYNVY